MGSAGSVETSSAQRIKQGEDAPPPSQRRVLTAAVVGNFVEWFDFALFAYTAPTFAVLFFPSADIGDSFLWTFFTIYLVPFLARPLGAAVWGHVGDRIGRRNTLSIVIVGMGIATALVGTLPTRDTLAAAPFLLAALRLLQAFFVGGETVGSQTFAIEQISSRHRGLWLGLIYSFAVVPFALVAVLILGLRDLLGDDAFEDWGWRLPFFVGGLVSLVGLAIRLRMAETRAFRRVAEARAVERAPLAVSVREYPRSMLAVFFAFGSSALAFYLLTGFFTSYLSESLDLSETAALWASAAALCVIGVLGPLFGALGDRMERRRPLVLAGTWLFGLGALPAFAIADGGGWVGALAGQTIIAVGISLMWAGAVPIMTEAFPTRIRYSGASVSYNIAFGLFGGTAPLVSQHVLNHFEGPLAPGVYAASVGIALAIGCVFFVPETANAALIKADEAPEPEPEAA